MKTLVTGGAGYFGSIMANFLLERGHEVVSFDLLKESELDSRIYQFQGDLRKPDEIRRCFDEKGPFDKIFHIAAMLAHAIEDKQFLWESNADGCRNLIEVAIEHGSPKIVFTSSNCVYGYPGISIKETDPPQPIEIYGESKLEGEKYFEKNKDKIDYTIIRCPTITSAGRLGLLAILFEFIKDNKKVYTVGSGGNRYQFIYAYDLAEAFYLAAQKPGCQLYNIGSDNVKTLKEIFQYVIDKAGSKSRTAVIPQSLAVFGMKLAHALKISPLGPYHYKMLSEDFIFDTSSIKEGLGWKPTKTNEEVLYEAYNYYFENLDKVTDSTRSAHKQGAKMGIIKLVKWLS